MKLEGKTDYFDRNCKIDSFTFDLTSKTWLLCGLNPTTVKMASRFKTLDLMSV